MARIRIIVADDHRGFLQRVTQLLCEEFDVVGTATQGEAILDLIPLCQPDVVVSDLEMPGFSALDLLRELSKNPSKPPVKVVICSVESDPEIVDAARRAGAIAYVFKARIERDLILAVKLAAEGKPFFHVKPGSPQI